MTDYALIEALGGLAVPFFLILLSMERKLTRLVTVVSICPNCPKVK